MKKTLVLGASPNPDRYSYRAVVALTNNGHEVIPIGIKTGTIESTPIINHADIPDNVHTITIYLNKDIQKEYYAFILKTKPKRVIFNPGTFNQELINLLKMNDIDVVEDCTLVMLSMGTY